MAAPEQAAESGRAQSPSVARSRTEIVTAGLVTNGGTRPAVPGAPGLRIDLLGDAGVWVGGTRRWFPTRRAELAVFCLALASPAGLHREVLLERLWPCAPADRGPARLRTLLWQVRRELGPEAWRVQRRGQRVVMVVDTASVDLLRARDAAGALLAAGSFGVSTAWTVVRALEQPLLVEWQFEDWVQAEAERDAAVVALLSRLARSR